LRGKREPLVIEETLEHQEHKESLDRRDRTVHKGRRVYGDLMGLLAPRANRVQLDSQELTVLLEIQANPDRVDLRDQMGNLGLLGLLACKE